MRFGVDTLAQGDPLEPNHLCCESPRNCVQNLLKSIQSAHALDARGKILGAQRIVPRPALPMLRYAIQGRTQASIYCPTYHRVAVAANIEIAAIVNNCLQHEFHVNCWSWLCH